MFITHNEWLSNRDDERHFYSFEAYHRLLPEEEGKRSKKAANNQRFANNRRKQELLEGKLPVITDTDLYGLTGKEKDELLKKYVFVSYNQYDSTTTYRLKTAKDRQNELERQAMENRRKTPEEYAALSPNEKQKYTLVNEGSQWSPDYIYILRTN